MGIFKKKQTNDNYSNYYNNQNQYNGNNFQPNNNQINNNYFNQNNYQNPNNFNNYNSNFNGNQPNNYQNPNSFNNSNFNNNHPNNYPNPNGLNAFNYNPSNEDNQNYNNQSNNYSSRNLYDTFSLDDNNENGKDKSNNNSIKKIVVVVLIIILAVLLFILFKENTSSSSPGVSLKLSEDTFELNVGDSKIIEYTIDGNKNVDITFSSSNPSIATVDESGKVTAISNGNTYIFVSYIVNGNKQGKICNVKVGNGTSETKVDDTNNTANLTPSCTLTVKSDGTIVATPVNATKYGFSETFNNGNETEYLFKSKNVVGVTKFDILPIEYYVENASGEKAKCSVVIEMTCKDLTSACTFRGV